MLKREIKDHGALSQVLLHPGRQSWGRKSIFLDGGFQIFLSYFSVWCIEHCPEVCCHFHASRLPGNISNSILLKMELTSLPGYASKYSLSSRSQANMVITADEFHSSHATIFQALQQGSPVTFMVT